MIWSRWSSELLISSNIIIWVFSFSSTQDKYDRMGKNDLDTERFFVNLQLATKYNELSTPTVQNGEFWAIKIDQKYYLRISSTLSFASALAVLTSAFYACQVCFGCWLSRQPLYLLPYPSCVKTGIYRRLS
jgi:hypothetical protein